MYVMYVNDSNNKIKIHRAEIKAGSINGCNHLFKFSGNDNPENIPEDYYKLFTHFDVACIR
jgi:hypothetical protein